MKWLQGRPSLRRFASTSALLFVERGIRMVVGLVVGILIARHLGAEGFGVLSYIIAIGSFMQPVAVFGMDVVGLRWLAAEPGRRETIIGGLLAIRATFGLASMCCIMLAVFLLDGQHRLQLAAPVAIATFLQASDVFDGYFQAIVDQRWSVAARLAALALATAGRLWLLVIGAPLLWFAWMIAIESALAAVGLAWAYRCHAGISLRGTVSLARRLLAEGWPLACAGVLTPLYTRLDQVLLEKILGSHEVGIYAVAVRLSECWFVIPGTLVAAMVPLALEARRRSEAEFRAKLQRLNDLLTWMAIIVAVLGCLFGPLAVRLLYGAEYTGSGAILMVLCWSGLFVSWGLVRSAAITAQGDFRFALVYTAVGAVLNLALNLLLIPRLGAVGAALAMLLSHATCSTVVTVIHPPLRWTLRMQWRSLMPVKAMINAVSGKERR